MSNRFRPVHALTVGLALALTGLSLTAVSCAPAESDDGLRAELRELSSAVNETREELAGLRREVKRQEHRIDSLADRPRHQAPSATRAAEPVTTDAETSGTASTAMPSASDEVDAPTAEVITRVLESDAGRQAIRAVAQQVQEQQKARELNTMVSYQLSRFAQDAGLDPHQITELRRTWSDVMEKAGAMTAKMRGFADLSPEEQQTVRAEIRTGMQGLAEERTSRIRNLLNDEQYELYVERQKEIDASLHGAPRSRPTREERPDSATR